MNWLNIENREFDGKKWEGMGWESKKENMLQNKNCDHLGREDELSFSFP